jgi:hypothetical protein
MAGIRPPDNAAPAAPPESTEGQHCTLFVLSSQYVLFSALVDLSQCRRFQVVVPISPMSDQSNRSRMAERLLAHATMCQQAASLSWDEAIALELEKLAEDCRQAAAVCEPDLMHATPTPWKH